MCSVLPRFAIVVPSLNQGSYIGEALGSLVAQDYPALEIAVMDGGSTDHSLRVIDSFAGRISCVRSAADGGQAAAINEGVARTSSDLVGWLNADDLLMPGALWRVAHAWSRHPARGLYLCNGFRHTEPGGMRIPFCRRHLALNRRALARGIDTVLQPATFFSREAWDAVGGLRPSLRYGLDWDLALRISARSPAVIIDESLAVSREHAETKTRRGGFERVAELVKISREHSGERLTPGAAHYVIEEVLDSMTDADWSRARESCQASFDAVHRTLRGVAGNADGFPERGDPQDVVDLPRVDPDWPRPRIAEGETLPTVSIVMPSLNQAAFLPRALDSALLQNYPGLELLVFDGGSTDGSAEILRRYEPRLNRCVIERDRGPAHAINKGFAEAQGEILGWLSSDDMLAHGALIEIGRAFAANPDVDLVYGNALYVDAHDEMRLADHGVAKTGVYFGEIQPPDRVPRYWEYVHALPQPTVFFRRRLLDACGALDERYRFIFDFDLFARMGRGAKAFKIDRALAFYRLLDGGKSADWRNFLIELYAFSRKRWPPVFSRAFASTWLGFVASFVRRRGGSARSLSSWALAVLAAASSATGIGNPEAWTMRMRRT